MMHKMLTSKQKSAKDINCDVRVVEGTTTKTKQNKTKVTHIEHSSCDRA